MNTLDTANQTLTTKRLTTRATLLTLATLTHQIPALNTTFLLATTTSLAVLYARTLNRVKHRIQNHD
jgi:hypothetical protein